jgi:hypothetical protein
MNEGAASALMIWSAGTSVRTHELALLTPTVGEGVAELPSKDWHDAPANETSPKRRIAIRIAMLDVL